MIDEAVFKSKLESLFEFYGKKQPLPMHFEVYLNRVKHRSTVDFVAGCQECMNTQIKFLPSPSELDGYIEAVVNRRATHEKRVEHIVNLNLGKKLSSDSEYFREAKELFNKRMDNKINSEELAYEMYSMDRKYPNLGWWECAGLVLFAAYVRKGVSAAEAKSLIPVKMLGA